MTLRLGTFNLMSGRSLADGSISPSAVAASGSALDADLLALQEVDRYQPRSGVHDQAAAIAESMGATDWRFEETVFGVPGETTWLPGRGLVAGDDRSAGFGIALLSRRPVREWRVLRLEAGRGRFPIVIPARPPRVLWLRDEPRAVLAAVLDEPRITVACAHLSFMPPRSVRQLRQVRDWLGELPGPVVLMGDLNLPGGLPARIMRWPNLLRAATFPSPRPRIQLDHVLAQDFSLDQVLSSAVRRLPISDHCAVTLDLDLSPGPG